MRNPIWRRQFVQNLICVIDAFSGQTTQYFPCQIVYHHPPIYGQMVHQTLDGATAVARSRRQKACQDPQCMQKSKRHKSKSRKSKANKPHKSAPSSPVGTPKKTFLTNPVTPSVTFNKPKKHELDLDPQWISAFPPVETPSEAGYPVMSGKLTGCCGRNLTHKPLSNSYSALD